MGKASRPYYVNPLAVTPGDRGPVWTGWVDGLLEQRIKLDLANTRR